MRSSDVNGMEVVVDTEKTLATLKENALQHSKIVAEAREGYLKRAMTALESKMEDLKSGKIVALHFNFQPPQDYSKVYDVAIKMLEMHTENTIVLNGAQVQHMVMDDWDWMETFLVSNKMYSSMAEKVSATKGF